MRKPWKQRYVEHIRGEYWAELKRKVLKRRGSRCERCGCSSAPLDMHHLHYKTFGKERQKDVRLLCRPCHRVEDAERKKKGMADRAWYRLCGDFGGGLSDTDFKLLEDAGMIRRIEAEQTGKHDGTESR